MKKSPIVIIAVLLLCGSSLFASPTFSQELLARAQAGDASAQCDLAWCYKEGLGIKTDCVEAVKWYRLAADQGLASAQYNLAWMYSKGEGVVQDNKEAVKWYRLASDQG
ncbi:MAG: tetratricopeptide repeat protein, partial [Candidatus Cloacimonadota bacterium]|nr:tetratricopeptide repeat protein [Candidatus Cloacimonadota bacterium]